MKRGENISAKDMAVLRDYYKTLNIKKCDAPRKDKWKTVMRVTKKGDISGDYFDIIASHSSVSHFFNLEFHRKDGKLVDRDSCCMGLIDALDRCARHKGSKAQWNKKRQWDEFSEVEREEAQEKYRENYIQTNQAAHEDVFLFPMCLDLTNRLINKAIIEIGESHLTPAFQKHGVTIEIKPWGYNVFNSISGSSNRSQKYKDIACRTIKCEVTNKIAGNEIINYFFNIELERGRQKPSEWIDGIKPIVKYKWRVNAKKENIWVRANRFSGDRKTYRVGSDEFGTISINNEGNDLKALVKDIEKAISNFKKRLLKDMEANMFGGLGEKEWNNDYQKEIKRLGLDKVPNTREPKGTSKMGLGE